MKREQVEKVIADVLEFLSVNGYLPQWDGKYGLYVNWNTKSISVSATEKLKEIRENAEEARVPSRIPFKVYNPSENGFWLIGFKNLLEAYGFAQLLWDGIYRVGGEKWSIYSSHGINHVPYLGRFF